MMSLRMKASSSPTGTVKRACSNTKNTAKSGAPVPAAAIVQVEPKEEKKYIHVHKFKNTNLYGAWFNDPSVEGKKKVRRFFGSHQTAYLAARAQDRAALKYRPPAVNPKKIKLNFKEEDYALDEGLRATMTNKEFGDLLRSESRPTYKKMEPTPLLRYFMAEERALGNLPQEVPNEAKAKNVIILEPHLINVIMNGKEKRKEKAEIPDLSFLREANEALSLMGIEDPFLALRRAAPKAKPVDHGPQEKRNKRRRAVNPPAGREEEPNKRPRKEVRFITMKFRSVAALNEPSALRSSAKPLETTPVSTVAVAKPKSVKEDIEVKQTRFPQRPRSKLPKRLASKFVTKFMAPGNARNKHQYKLQKVGITWASKLTQEVEEMVPEVEKMVPEVKEMVPEVEKMVPEMEEMVPEVEEKESMANNFSLFMLADVAALQ